MSMVNNNITKDSVIGITVGKSNVGNTKVKEGKEITICAVCGEAVTEDDILSDNSVCCFILYINGKRQVFPTHKACYLSDYNCKRYVINHYKDEFMVESI